MISLKVNLSWIKPAAYTGLYGATGKVLLKIDQERRSGVGAMGGDYVELMQRNLRAIGEDMALVFSKF